MDETINKWLWIGIGAVVCTMMLVAATPIGNKITAGMESIVDHVTEEINFTETDDDTNNNENPS